MEKFSKEYRCTEIKNEVSVLKRWGVNLPSGIYNEGVFEILNENECRELKSIIGDFAIPIVRNGVGDYFYYNEKDAYFYYLSLEHNTNEFITKDINDLLNNFFTIDEIQENILSKSLIDHNIIVNRPLTFGEVFILSPLQILGGDPTVNKFNISSQEVYLEILFSIIGQK